jgi:hypothetical protein
MSHPIPTQKVVRIQINIHSKGKGIDNIGIICIEGMVRMCQSCVVLEGYRVARRFNKTSLESREGWVT